LETADGYGASGANDDEFGDERAAARKTNKPFAIHAGEPDATDIHPALDMEPDLLVHMIHAADDHLDRVAEQETPIVACPRTNATLNLGRPPLSDLLAHTTVALGTDNVMLNEPSMFREMAYTAMNFDVSDREVLRMATTAGAGIADLNCGIIEPGRRAALLILDATRTIYPVRSILFRQLSGARPDLTCLRSCFEHRRDHSPVKIADLLATIELAEWCGFVAADEHFISDSQPHIEQCLCDRGDIAVILANSGHKQVLFTGDKFLDRNDAVDSEDLFDEAAALGN
jgi:Cytosine deaminase and related metal-dependent hydrolases